MLETERPTIEMENLQELRELQKAATKRVEALEKLRDKTENEGAPTGGISAMLRLWNGGTEEPGILARIAEQRSLFEDRREDRAEKKPEPQMSAFDQAPVHTDPNPTLPRERRIAAISSADPAEVLLGQTEVTDTVVQDANFEVVEDGAKAAEGKLGEAWDRAAMDSPARHDAEGDDWGQGSEAFRHEPEAALADTFDSVIAELVASAPGVADDGAAADRLRELDSWLAYRSWCLEVGKRATKADWVRLNNVRPAATASA